MSILNRITGSGRIMVFNLVLLFLSALLAYWGLSVLFAPAVGLESGTGRANAFTPARVEEGEALVKVDRGSFSVIIEKDVFRESRGKVVKRQAPPPLKVVQPSPPPEPVVKRPPPKLSLVGTVLLENGNAAIIEYGGKPSYYVVGENIEEFVIREIGRNHVLLERDGEPLRVGISPAQ